jgi:hypothetical protein
MLKEAWRKIRRIYTVADAVGRGRAVDVLAHETEELENIFALLVLGAFVGLPSPPIQVTCDLMPQMERDLHLMLEKVSTAHDPLGDLFSVLSID